MARHRHVARFAALAALILLVTHGSALAQAPPSDVVAAARTGLPAFLSAMRDPSRLGFTTPAEVQAATLGEGFRVYTIPPDVLLKAESPSSLKSLAVPTTMWQFVVVSDGVPKALLTVDRTRDGWAAVSIGAAGLASEVSDISRAWPAAAGYQRTFIRVYQATADFIEVSQSGAPLGIVPLGAKPPAAAGAAPRFGPQDLRGAAETLTALKPIVRRNLAGRQ